MPQMSPLMWELLSLSVLLVTMALSIVIYFMLSHKPLKSVSTVFTADNLVKSFYWTW